MKNTYLVFFSFLFVVSSFAQTVTKNIESFKLENNREVKIRLPKSYKKTTEKRYPLILTLDGDYLFDPLVGNVKYFSYWDDMPECIVVGIKQLQTRREDCRYDTNSQMPEYEGKKFYDFIAEELIPHLEKNYRTAKFKIIMGHDYTSNFINYFMFEKNPIFHAYINLSPDYASSMTERVTEKLNAFDTKIWYYLATSTNDVKGLRDGALRLNDELLALKNENLNYSFNNFEDGSHYSLVATGIPKALENIFSVYRPISKKEYEDVISKLTSSPYEYLTDKYKVIEDYLGVYKKVRVNDFVAISTTLEETENWDELEKLGNLARKLYPEHMLGNYFLGTAYENQGKPKQAMRTYQNGFLLREISFLNKDIMLQKADRIKEDFGYR